MATTRTTNKSNQPTSWRIPRDGGYLYAETWGEGTPVVLLRGWGRSIRHWMGFDELMSREFRVITIDARGIGRSHVPVPWSLTTMGMAADVVAVLDHLHIDRAHICGVSLGGMVALTFAKEFPQRTRSVISINSSFRGSGSLRISPSALKTVARGITDKKQLPRLLGEVLVSPVMQPDVRKRVVETWEQIDALEGLDNVTAFKQLLAAARFGGTGYLRGINVPTLLIRGSDDIFVPNANSLKLSKLISQARLVTIEHAGHEPTLDQPQAVADAIKEHVRRTDA